MASSNRVSWNKRLKENICSNNGQGWSVIGEGSGKTKLTYRYQEGRGMYNKRSSRTLPIEWKETNFKKIENAVAFIAPLVAEQNIELKEATRRWQAQFIGEETKTPNK